MHNLKVEIKEVGYMEVKMKDKMEEDFPKVDFKTLLEYSIVMILIGSYKDDRVKAKLEEDQDRAILTMILTTYDRLVAEDKGFLIMVNKFILDEGTKITYSKS